MKLLDRLKRVTGGFKFALNKNLAITRKRRVGVTTPGSPERDMTTLNRQQAMASTRQKVEESPIVSGILSTLSTNIVGCGFGLKMTTDNGDYNKEVQRRWDLVKNKLDIRGVRDWGELQEMWYSRRAVDGDVGIIQVRGGLNKDGTFNSRLQTVEADRIRRKVDGSDTGIEQDRFGKAKRYFVGSPLRGLTIGAKDNKEGRPIDAKFFIHYAHWPQHRSERQRGISMFLQNLNAIEDFEQIMEGILQKVKNESFLGVKWTINPTDGGDFGGEAMKVKEAEDGIKRRHMNLLAGTNVQLGEGEDVAIIEGKNPKSEFMQFMRLIIRFMGTNMNLPLEMILMDFSDTNFSGGRGLMELAKKRFKVEQKGMKLISSRIFVWWLSREINLNGLTVPVDVIDTRLNHKWGTPGWPYLDPLKEIQAAGIQLDRGLTTHQRILSEIGDDDFDEIIKELEREKILMEKHNIPYITGLPASNIIEDEDQDAEEDE